eukprot:TRINITY_DN781_c0_g2_i1.p1 TRINITY_DN781_c0_g2~~TRINITY_DN781_c0_g2_i1.p1  ORF type:complete len:276 (+),score=45.47 TRINITY_DN781_c0_g2_i1:64-891(+)
MTLRIALCQLSVGSNKKANISEALLSIKKAVEGGAQVVVLPECFNSPYGPKYFPEYAEPIPNGETSLAMAKAAKDHNIHLIAGSIPEKADDGNLYNTSTTYSPTGELIAKYRKMHLFKINTPEFTFDESETLTGGSSLCTFELPEVKVGLGICFDARYPQMAQMYTQLGTGLLIYPGAFNILTGPDHWQLTARARAVDSQQFVVFCSPSRLPDSDYVAYGHSLVVDPWGNVLVEAEEGADVIFADLDLSLVQKTRSKLPIQSGTRTDIYRVNTLK